MGAVGLICGPRFVLTLTRTAQSSFRRSQIRHQEEIALGAIHHLPQNDEIIARYLRTMARRSTGAPRIKDILDASLLLRLLQFKLRHYQSLTPTSAACRVFRPPQNCHNVCYRCIMLTLIFALAVRLVAHVAGAVAARLSRFLAVSLLGLAAGKMSSLPGGQGKWRNGLMSRQNFGPTGRILGRNRKFSLRFPVGRENRRRRGSMRGGSSRRRRSPADHRFCQELKRCGAALFLSSA